MVRLASLLGGLMPLAAVVSATPVPAELEPRAVATLGRSDDWSCKSAVHPNPVILLHGLFASEKLDLNFVEVWLRNKGFCTFALLYSSYTPKLCPSSAASSLLPSRRPRWPPSSRRCTDAPARKRWTLPATPRAASRPSTAPSSTASAPSSTRSSPSPRPPTAPTSRASTTWSGCLGKFSHEAVKNLLAAVGCGACNDFASDGDAVRRLNDGKPIVQPGNTVTIIASRYDEIVTPATTAFVQEPGVNIFVQDYCPIDPVGHIGVAVDMNVWRLFLNSLERKIGRKFTCLLGPPGR